ncbi:beta-lactamase family protein [Nakamurella flavida]|uniref:Beta-lactamase family protein n=1 Tax=Nakamurella flavida TaxID=363630 RepID=A0A938YM65_9ACTN|nr:serine hydrolase domain-containing protein [Nakamurella flavida]MBM9477258.1 beta-lactamase family protein [Nakamurella flavida]
MDLRQQLEHWPVGSAAVAVVGPGGVLASVTVGTPTARFRWASVTKVLTALTVLDAALDGTVSLDDPAGPPGATLAHLLSHCSGVSMDSDRVLAAPGTRRVYSNRGIELAAEHLTARTGTDFAAELHDRVLDPLGMAETELAGSPAHGAESSIDDLARLAAELLHSTHLLPGVVAAASTTAFPGLSGVLPGYGRQEHNDWGLGCEIRDHKSPHWTSADNSPATFGHFGQSGSFLWVDPEADLACVSLCDTAFGPWAVQAWPPLATAVLAAHRDGTPA